MPIHDLGYRSWQGQRSSHRWRPWTVARNGVSLIWRSKWLRLMLMLGWIPSTFFFVGIGLFEYSNTDIELRRATAAFAAGPLARPEIAMQIMQDPDSVRHRFWSAAIFSFFRYPQLVTMVVLVGLIAPRLVSYDLRSKAYLQYFARPLTPLEYVVGKSAVIWFFLAMITTLPAIALYIIGVALSPGLMVVQDTWDIPLRIFLATVVLVVPTTAVATCFASLTHESRYATFSWFAMWIMGGVAYLTLTYAGAAPARGPAQYPAAHADAQDRGTQDRGTQRGQTRSWDQAQRENDRISNPSRRRRPTLSAFDLDRWIWVSPYHILGKTQSWIFGLESDAAVPASSRERSPSMRNFPAENTNPGLEIPPGQFNVRDDRVSHRRDALVPAGMLVVATALSTWVTRRRLIRRLSL